MKKQQNKTKKEFPEFDLFDNSLSSLYPQVIWMGLWCMWVRLPAVHCEARRRLLQFVDAAAVFGRILQKDFPQALLTEFKRKYAEKYKQFASDNFRA